MGRNILKSSIENASFSIFFQVLFRIITFVLNAFIIRHVGQTVLGIMNVRLLLLESTILFLSKEPILKACLSDTKSHNWAQVINQIWLTVPFTAIVAMFFVYVWTNILSGTDGIYWSQYYLGCYAIALSCVIDQISQSVVIVAQSYCFVRLKVVIDTIYIIFRTVVFVLLVLKYPNSAINAFSLAQIFSSLVFCLSYYGFFLWYIQRLNLLREQMKIGDKTKNSDDEFENSEDEDVSFISKEEEFVSEEEEKDESNNRIIHSKRSENDSEDSDNEFESNKRENKAEELISEKETAENNNTSVMNAKKIEHSMFSDMHDFPFRSLLDFFPGFMDNWERPLNPNLCILALSFFKQCIVKQVLTEGEKYVMTVSPVLTFSQQSMYDIVNNLGSLAARFLFRPIEESAYFYFTQMVRRDEPITQQSKTNITEATVVLNQLCKIVTSIGLMVVIFGQSYSFTLLYLYGGRALTDDMLPTTLLRFHCIAVLLLAINGVTECYVFATMNSEQLNRYNYVMVIFSIVFLLVSYIFTLLFGPVGFILANCINMAARIGHSLYFIHRKYHNTVYKPLDGLIPDKYFVITLVVMGLITKLSEEYLLRTSIIFHIFVGAACFGLTVMVWAYKNKELLKIGLKRFIKKED